MPQISDKQLIMPVARVVSLSLLCSIWMSLLYHDDINIELHNKIFFYIPINNNTPQLLSSTQISWVIFTYLLITIFLCYSFAFLTKKIVTFTSTNFFYKFMIGSFFFILFAIFSNLIYAFLLTYVIDTDSLDYSINITVISKAIPIFLFPAYLGATSLYPKKESFFSWSNIKNKLFK